VGGVKRTGDHEENTLPRKEQKTSNTIPQSKQTPISSLPIPPQSQPQLDLSEKQPQAKKSKTSWDYAKEWFDLGKVVVPLSTKGDGAPNDGKFPCVIEWQKTTLEQSKTYLSAPTHKNKNWGLLTGKLNNLFVVDLDIAKENQLSGVEYLLDFMIENDIKCNHMVRTGSGGYHLYFKWDQQKHLPLFAGLEINGKKYGIDVRSDKGQIVMPGSFHYKSGKKYELMPNDETGEEPKIDQLEKMDSKLFEHLHRLKYPTISQTIAPITNQNRMSMSLQPPRRPQQHQQQQQQQQPTFRSTSNPSQYQPNSIENLDVSIHSLEGEKQTMDFDEESDVEKGKGDDDELSDIERDGIFDFELDMEDLDDMGIPSPISRSLQNEETEMMEVYSKCKSID
jgi:hypothetical protein